MLYLAQKAVQLCEVPITTHTEQCMVAEDLKKGGLKIISMTTPMWEQISYIMYQNASHIPHKHYKKLPSYDYCVIKSGSKMCVCEGGSPASLAPTLSPTPGVANVQEAEGSPRCGEASSNTAYIACILYKPAYYGCRT